MQSMITLWYLTDGRDTDEAKQARQQMGEWDTEWSLRHMVRLCRRIVIREKIEFLSRRKLDLRQLADQLENYLFLAG